MAVDDALIGGPLRVGSQLGKPTRPEASYDSTRSATPTGSDRGSLSPMKVPHTLSDLALGVDRDMQSLWMRLQTVQQERALTQAGHQLQHTPRDDGKAHKVLFVDDEPAWISWDRPLLSTAPRPSVPPPPVPPPPPAPYVPVDRDSWRRRKQALEAQPLSEPKWCTPPKQKEVLISLGSVGHPYTCGAACKYVRRKSGCRDGANCPSCHQCVWNRKATREEVGQAERAAAPMRVDLAPPAPAVAPAHIAPPLARAAGQPEGAADGTTASLGHCMGALVAEEEAPSLGSIGHPYLCAKACKYNAKHRGCKDGRCCVRCHLCMWRRCLQ